MQKPHLILASASIGRKGLLEKLKIPFSILPSRIDEEAILDPDPYIMLENRARAKAEDVLNVILANEVRPESTPDPGQARMTNTSKSYKLTTNGFLVVAADSMAIVGDKTYGKAKNVAHVRQMVAELSGRTHTFTTATTIIYLQNGRELKRWETVTKTSVELKKMSAEEIAIYTTRYDFTRFAAGYTLNETPWDIVQKIDGSYTNVIGLPFEVLLPILRKPYIAVL